MLTQTGVSYTFSEEEAKIFSLREYTYEKRFLPLNQVFSGTVYCVDCFAFLTILDTWNRQSNDWKYCSL